MVGVVLLRIVDSAQLDAPSWDGEGVEVLLQRRSKIVPHPQLYCPPCGAIEAGEKRVAYDTSAAPDERTLALWHAALRELIEEAGGGAPPRGEATTSFAARAYPPDPPATYEDVALPPELLAPPSATTVFWLGDAAAREPRAGRGQWFAHVVADGAWATDWQPRALPDWRDEIDETCRRKHHRWGYVWADLKRVFDAPDAAVPSRGGAGGLVPWLATLELFSGGGKAQLLGVVRQAAAARRARAAMDVAA